MFKYIFLFIFFIENVFSTTIDKNNPYYLMHNIINKTFLRIKNEQIKIRNNPNYLSIIVKQELSPYINIKYAGALALGHYYNECTPLQLENYFQIFKLYLERAYGQILTLYNNQSYQIALEKPIEKNVNIVSIQVIIKNIDQSQIHLDFQWRKNSISNKWQIYDMIAEGVSMIIIKQNEWSSILRLDGINKLIRQLQLDSKKPIEISTNINDQAF